MQAYTRTGWLTDYAMSCGYIHSMTDHTGARVTLWKEHSVFHVRATNRESGSNTVQSFHSITEARAAYLAAVK